MTNEPISDILTTIWIYTLIVPVDEADYITLYMYMTSLLQVLYNYIRLRSIHSLLQVFVIDITWNNSERYEIYRRYSDFFSFQVCKLSLVSER